MPSAAAEPLFPGARDVRATVDGIEVAAWVMGAGPPVLLLHGYPQTRAMWHRVAPRLAERFTVVVADLRGYGDSSAPEGDPAHEHYSKRAMAADQVGLMEELGHTRFAVVGHDRGGRVGHRMALDHPNRVTRLAVLDIVPTRVVFATARTELATAYFHWFFLIQPDELPERLIGADPGYWLDEILDRWSATDAPFDDRAVSEYRRCFVRAANIHASCEDYRAAATIDLEHDAVDRARLQQPLLVLWGLRGAMNRLYDVPDTWADLAVDQRSAAIDCGHFLAEERPGETSLELERFLDG
ncbi:MAG: alpha/beta hydrolase [Thermoleophilia bacterium]|nr:alpha/beta hydrolase [Thermoleophilia bacterium]